MLAYSFIFPESQIAAHWINMKNRLVGFLKGIPIYEMEIPGEYNDVVFKEVSSNINLILKE